MRNEKWQMENALSCRLLLPTATCLLPTAASGIDEAIQFLSPVLIEILQNIVLFQRRVAVAHG